ncbi:MAG TPA: alpha/beta hydrolase [Steroidobacteraceae bacterium]|nr:alpha/beta hydrolase [Steroidobacteraceae bacterium]
MRSDKQGGVSRRTLLAGLIATLAAGCGRAAFMAANLPAAFGPYRRRRNVVYGDDPQHRLDVYVPDKVSTEPRPLVVFWHGGRWRYGDKADYRFVGAALAELGYVAVLPNYRHYPDVKMAGFMDDAARAGQWAAAHAGDFGADANRLYLMGHSAGAHLAALVTLDRRYFARVEHPAPSIAGVIGLSGPYDFLPLLETDVQDMFGPPPNYPASQPINFVRPGAPPMLLVHGLKDDTVRPKNSRNLAAALEAVGVPVTLRLYPNLAHADTAAALSLPARGRAPILVDIAAFVDAVGRDQAALAAGAAAGAAGSARA